MGFSLIILKIIESKRPIIGHFMCLDLLYIYDQCIDRLPDTYLEFVEKVQIL